MARSSEQRGGAFCLTQPLTGHLFTVETVPYRRDWKTHFDGLVTFSAPGYDSQQANAVVTVTRLRDESEGMSYLAVVKRPRC